jgi:hypothetical protein
MNPDGSCSHLYEIGEEDRNKVMKQYRKVMGWSVSDDMMTDASIRNGSLVSRTDLELCPLCAGHTRRSIDEHGRAMQMTVPSCGVCSRATIRPSVCLECDLQLCRVSSTLASSRNKHKLGQRDRDCMRGHFQATGHSLGMYGTLAMDPTSL